MATKTLCSAFLRSRLRFPARLYTGYRAKHSKVLNGIPVKEFKERREKLIDSISEWSRRSKNDAETHIVIIPSATKLYMTENIPYPFRQNSDFRYLCGALEPDCVLVLRTTNHGSILGHSSALFLPHQDEVSILWDGPRMTPDTAVPTLGINEAYESGHLAEYLVAVAGGCCSAIIWFDSSACVQKSVANSVRELTAASSARALSIRSPKSLIQELRLIKSATEATLMARSCEIVSDGFLRTMEDSYPGVAESYLWSKVEYECRANCAERLAYPPVIAGGNRANIIHYIENNHVIEDGQMVLMDAGCEYEGYVSDVTRTWPVNGKFSARQKEIYDIVLEVQGDLIELCKQHLPLDELHRRMVHGFAANLQRLGIDVDKSYKMVNRLCPHHVGHYLGLDVHDTGLISRSRPIVPGMVITIEPGLYIRDGDQDWPVDFHGIGIRIEDDVLVTEDGCTVLSSGCLKSRREIERIVSKKHKTKE